MTEIEYLRRRVRNQRRALRTMGRYIKQQDETIQAAYRRSTALQNRVNELFNSPIRMKLRKLWYWWRNRIVWRIGCFIRGNRQHWEKRNYYEKGRREGFNEAWKKLGLKETP